MARYTFAAGNAAKLLRLPLYGLGALASLVVPRSDALWVFGSGTGVGEGAAPLYRAARERLPEKRLVWLAGSPAELETARAAGFEAALKRGWRGFRLTLRARVVVVTHGFGDANRYGSRGAFVVQLWHGIPLKRLHADSPEAHRLAGVPDLPPVRALLQRAYRWSGRGISLFPVASELAAARIRTAFALPASRVAVTGDPRDDVLFSATREQARALVEAAVGPLPPRVLLYAPTWRDGRDDPAAPSEADWTAIAELLEREDAALLVRTHPLGHGDYARGPEVSPRIRLLGADLLGELTPALPAVDVLVTDYSSVAFDFSLLGRPIVFLAPDVDDYVARRGLYAPYRDFAGGRWAVDWPGVLAMLDADPAEAIARARNLRDESFDLEGGGATERVLDEILRRLGDARAGSAVASRRPRPRVVGLEWDAALPGITIRVEGDVASARLDGPRAAVEGRAGGDGSFTFPLTASRWGGPELPLPSGGYRLLLDGSARVEVAADVDPLRTDALVASVSAGGGLLVRVGPPLAPDEDGARNQRRLERAYRRARAGAEDAVFLESFYGQNASDNPLGIDRALARLRPGTRRYWSVVDRSVVVPEGAIPIVEGSREWWRVRASARVLVVNDWLRKRYRRRPHQHVLQTWHGTMLKRLALDRPGRDGIVGRLLFARTRLAILRERDRWDALLAQNDYSARIFRHAYAMRRPIWQLGYPRNDRLAGADVAAIRARLGVAEGARIVFYAPTWRDDRRELVDHLDLPRFAEELPAGVVLLVRGHSRTLRFGRDLTGERLVDVTTYPDVAELLAVADVLVTDYSSLMFDWMTTDRPIVFFTPDLAHYSEDLRGFYFDLLAEAPGPVVHDRAGLLAVLAEPSDGHAERRAAWRERFTPLDDGGAGARVVERLVAEGWL